MSSGKRSSSDTKSDAGSRPGLLWRLCLLLFVFAWAFVIASLIGFNAGDPPSHMKFPPNDPVMNWCGPLGALVAYGLFRTLGWGAWILTVVGGVGLLSAAGGQRIPHASTRLVGLLFMAVAVSGLQRLMWPTSGVMPDLAGGAIGVVGVDFLSGKMGSFGTGLALIAMFAIGALVAIDEWLVLIFGWTWQWTKNTGAPMAGNLAAGTAKATGAFVANVAAPAAGKIAVGAAKTTGEVSRKAGGGLFSALSGMLAGRKPVEIDASEEETPKRMRKPKSAADAPMAAFPGEAANYTSNAPEYDIEEDPTAEIEDPDVNAASDAEDADDEAAAPPAPRAARPPIPVTRSSTETRPAQADEDDAPGAPQVFDKDALREKINKLPLALGQNKKAIATDADLKALQAAAAAEEAASNYAFPGLDLLENPEENFNAKLEEHVREQAAALEAALQQYKINGEVVGIESGPVITLFDVRLAPGTKVAQVQAVDSDIARALKAVNIRIVSNMAGRDTVGIEVPNTHKEKVRLKELMSRSETFAKMRLPMFLGKDASGESLIADLTQMPHMLIAGTTGSGKSVCMNTIIMSFLYTKKPNELKLVLVDPKMVEMSQFKDIPHLMCPVVTEMSKAAAILEWATTKMDERYELLAEAGCRDIATYNELPFEELKERMGITTEEEEARVPKKLPYMVFIIDELADLMMTAKEVESHIIRIAQKARAVGLHLILATQRPQANVVTGLIKSNMPCRISFKVASGMDSRIVLDQKGGELLLGHGDMLFLNPRSSKLTRAQGTLVDDLEIRRVVKFMRDVAKPSFERQLLTLRKPSENGTGLSNLSDEERLLQSQNNSSASLAAAQEDPLFQRAVEIVLETRRGSVSLLQRRLAIGYTRASRLIDLMGIAGIISDHKGSVARDVLITPEEWDAMKELAASEAAQKGIANPLEARPDQQALFEEKTAAAPGPTAAEAVVEDADEEASEAVDEEDVADAEDEEDDADEVAEAAPFDSTDDGELADQMRAGQHRKPAEPSEDD
ncbi:MAG: DNA translocase FtsK 4TM domain-containing protein [Planctomycetota bacterium]|nr:DNA translocase FtsK 4TM domain-containing protein [Planctomycetota bacterium]